MANYQQIFLDNAFGNFETLLTKVTLSSSWATTSTWSTTTSPSSA